MPFAICKCYHCVGQVFSTSFCRYRCLQAGHCIQEWVTYHTIFLQQFSYGYWGFFSVVAGFPSCLTCTLYTCLHWNTSAILLPLPSGRNREIIDSSALLWDCVYLNREQFFKSVVAILATSSLFFNLIAGLSFLSSQGLLSCTLSQGRT